MTRQEHLLVRAMEECNEVAQRISKALVFGLDEVQEGQHLTNRDRIIYEWNDLIALMEMLQLNATVPEAIEAKTAKVEKYLAHSAKMGRLEERT